MSKSRQQSGTLLYTATQTRNLLYIRGAQVVRLRDSSMLPSYRPHGQRRYVYDALHVDYVASLAQLARHHGSPGRDIALIELCYLQRVYESYPPGTSRWDRERHAASVNKQCRAMVADGRATTVAMLAKQLSDFATKQTVERWAINGKIASIKIGLTQYLSVQYCKALVRLISEYIPLAQASEDLGCSYDKLQERAQQGKLAGLRGPDGKLRISPATLARLCEEREANELEENLTFAAAATVLNVDIGTLRARISDGSIESVGFGPTRRIPRRVVEKLNARRTGLNPGFEWLDTNIARSGRRATTLTTRQAFRRLNISPSTLTVWSQLNLLPYYVISVGDERDTRVFVSLYIHGLVRFAGGGKVSRKQATEYRRRCAEAQIIV